MSKQLEGIAEMDETQFKYSEKESRQLSAGKARKRGTDKAPISDKFHKGHVM